MAVTTAPVLISVANSSLVDTWVDDPMVTPPTTGYGPQPIVKVYDTSNVTLQNDLLTGRGDGGYHADLVGSEGIKILSSSGCKVRDVKVQRTWGDGLYVGANQPKDRNPVSGLEVENLRVWSTGRMGVTMAECVDSVFTNVSVIGSANNSWDFESDLSGVGCGNIRVNIGFCANGVRMIQHLTGPITFQNYIVHRHITLSNQAALSGQPVLFQKCILFLPRSQPGITIDGPGHMRFEDCLIYRLPGVVAPGPAWQVTNGGVLEFVRGEIRPPMGTQDATSTVTIAA